MKTKQIVLVVMIATLTKLAGPAIATTFHDVHFVVQPLEAGVELVDDKYVYTNMWGSRKFSDGYLVWKEYNGVYDPYLYSWGSTYEGHIKRFNGDTTAQLSLDYPVTSQGNVAWRTEGVGVAYYSNSLDSTEYLRLGSSSNHLAIYENSVAWGESGYSQSGGGGMWLFDGTNVNTITTDITLSGFYPSLGEGGLVYEGIWFFMGDDPTDQEILLYDGQFKQVTNNDTLDSNPMISGHYVTCLNWPSWASPSTFRLMLYDLTTQTSIALTDTLPNASLGQSMWNNHVAWSENGIIRYFDGNEIIGLGEGNHPSVGELGIVWATSSGILHYDGTKITTIWESGSSPIISGNQVAWTGSIDGRTAYYIATTPEPPALGLLFLGGLVLMNRRGRLIL